MNRIMILVLALMLQFTGTAAAASSKFITLCYHDVRYDVLSRVDRDTTAMSVRNLGEHFSWLRENGYTPVSMATLQAAERGEQALPEKPVLLSFDDGYESFYSRIYPLLKEFQYPAVYALTTAWLEVPANQQVAYGDELRPRSDFLSWAQVREMSASGLVELASHTHDMHRAHESNPYGSLRPVATSMGFDSTLGIYESIEQYQQRVLADLRTSVELIRKHTGVTPQAIVWPYGSYTPAAMDLARQVGLSINMTLDNGYGDTGSLTNIPRVLIGGNPTVTEMAWSLNSIDEPDFHRGMFVSLADIWSDDAEQLVDNVSSLLDNVKELNPTHVYLSIADDMDGNGQYDVAWFPNDSLAVKGEIFDWVSWSLKTRAGVEVLAWVDPAGLDGFGSDDGRREFLANVGVFSGTRGILSDNTRSFDELLKSDGLYAGMLHNTKSAWLGRAISENDAHDLQAPRQESSINPFLTVIKVTGRKTPRALVKAWVPQRMSISKRIRPDWNQVVFSVPDGERDVKGFEKQVRRLRAEGVRDIAVHGVNPGDVDSASTWFEVMRRAISASVNPYEP